MLSNTRRPPTSRSVSGSTYEHFVIGIVLPNVWKAFEIDNLLILRPVHQGYAYTSHVSFEGSGLGPSSAVQSLVRLNSRDEPDSLDGCVFRAVSLRDPPETRTG